MSETLRLPVLSLPDTVVLPGMVVPVELDEAAQGAVDAARAGADGRLLLTPRMEDRYPGYGAVAKIEQVGRMPGGSPAAVLRATGRARIGSGVTGPGAALWVEAELVDNPPATDDVRKLAAEFKTLVIANLQRRDAWQLVDS
ncbi:MAG TPA: LON peptidase substrate-binding domain-containing protein, partial [Jatrophihabitantaceae bacterium]